MSDFAPRDGINMTDALEEHRRVICSAFGIPADRLDRNPYADFIRAYREAEATVFSFLNDRLKAFTAHVEREEQLADFHRKFDASINEQIKDSENREALTAEQSLPARTALSVGEGR